METGIQMLTMGFLLVGPNGPNFVLFHTLEIGITGLWVAASLTVVTGIDYLLLGLRHIRETDNAPAQRNPGNRKESPADD